MRQRMTLILQCLLLLATALLSACASHTHRCHEDIYCEAKQYYERGLYHLAFNKVSFLAYRGDTRAQYALGRMYYYGTGTAEDTQQGRMWIRVAASKNYPPALEAISLIEDSDTPQYTEFEPKSIRKSSMRSSDNLRKRAVPIVNTPRKTKTVTVSTVHPKTFSQPLVSEINQLPETELKVLPLPALKNPIRPKIKTVSQPHQLPVRVVQLPRPNRINFNSTGNLA